MILLAANGSPILNTLFSQGDLPIDLVKCPLSGNSRGEVTQFRPYRPVILHGWGPVYWIGQRGVPEPELLRELMAVSGSPYVSTHLDAQPGDFDAVLTPETALARIIKNVHTLREITGAGVLVENIPYFSWGKSLRFTTDPDFIRMALEASGAAFLLDLAHAKVSAWHRGEDFRAYLDALPFELVREVHLSRPRLEDKGMRDRHLPLKDEDYSLLQALLPKLPNVGMVALEYGGLSESDGIARNDPEALREQITRLRTLIDEANHAA